MLTHLDFPNFQADMLSKKGLNLHLIEDDDESAMKIERFIDRVLLIVETEVKTYNKRFDYKISPEPQQKAFFEACLEQALYLHLLGDHSLISGYDPINNTVIPIDEIRKRAFSPFAKQMLINEGLMFRGVSNMTTGQAIPGYGRRGGYF